MAALFEKILCPVDTGDVSVAAINAARELAREHGGAIWLLHVVPLIPAAGVVYPAETFARMKDRATEVLAELARDHLEGRAAYRIEVHIGDPAADILESVEKLGADSVVMATHGRKGLSRLLLGSVAEIVVRKAPCPVLTIRP